MSLTRRFAVALGLLMPLALAGCSSEEDGSAQAEGLGALGAATPLALSHATQFTLDAYEGGYRLASLATGSQALPAATACSSCPRARSPRRACLPTLP